MILRHGLGFDREPFEVVIEGLSNEHEIVAATAVYDRVVATIAIVPFRIFLRGTSGICCANSDPTIIVFPFAAAFPCGLTTMRQDRSIEPSPLPTRWASSVVGAHRMHLSAMMTCAIARMATTSPRLAQSRSQAANGLMPRSSQNSRSLRLCWASLARR